MRYKSKGDAASETAIAVFDLIAISPMDYNADVSTTNVNEP